MFLTHILFVIHPDSGAMDVEDEQMRLAIEMSKHDTGAGAPEPFEDADMNEVINDADFLNSVLSSLPGVDPNDEKIQVKKTGNFSKTNEKIYLFL